MIEIEKAIVTEAVRKLADLSDVARAIAVAAKLMSEKLERLQEELLNLFTKEED
jgi:hypothetical protein